METMLKVSPTIQDLFCCPVDKGKLQFKKDHFACSLCNTSFPIVDGIPIFINEKNSLFKIGDFKIRSDTFFRTRSAVVEWVRKSMPKTSANYKAQNNYETIGRILLERKTPLKILVLGGSIIGGGLKTLLDNPSFEVIETDVSLGPRTMVVCDAHDIPFENNTFDGVISQAVLEHVIDPFRCVSEIHRVLKSDGIVYAETPFMQQVHAGRYDFTRFTHLGHRRLFRQFTELESGVVCGPGMALAWAYEYFLLSFSTNKWMRRFLRLFAHFTSFYLKYFDRFLINKAGSYDAASAYYFIGEKSTVSISDKEIITLYRGAI